MQQISLSGLIDATHILVRPPRQHEAQFIDRHRQHSINAQFIVGPHMEIYDTYVNMPGSVHDTRVLRRSPIGQRFAEGWRPFDSREQLSLHIDTGIFLIFDLRRDGDWSTCQFDQSLSWCKLKVKKIPASNYTMMLQLQMPFSSATPGIRAMTG